MGDHGPARFAAAPDAGVAALAMSGDLRAFEELVRRRQGAVRDLMRRLCGERALADDLAQEAFVQAWRSISDLRAPGAFGGWLRRVAITVWLQEARRARLDLAPGDEAADLADPLPTADGSNARIDLDRALARLKPGERLCVVLCHAEGLSHGEIVAVTGLPLGTVKSHVARGAARLRVMLQE